MKKMRRMIPALCMLLVSAIMLSTASYAWFTMNDAVTASGMQVKAEAAGALIISKSPLTSAGGEPSVEFNSTVKSLTQITLDKDTWKQPDTVENGAIIDQVTGVVTGKTELVEVNISNRESNSYFYDEEIYIGVAGAKKENQQLELTLTAPSSAAGTATYAYAIAVYVLGVYTEADTAVNAHANINEEPHAIVWVDKSLKEDGTPRNTAKIDLDDLEIPSIEGVGEQDEKVTGLKIAIRMFVDGNLASTEKTYVTKSVALKAGQSIDSYDANKSPTTITYENTFVSGRKYFIEDDGVERPALNTDNLQDGAEIPTEWYYYVDQVSEVYVKYVNNQNVPATGSTLAIQFKAVDAPAGE